MRTRLLLPVALVVVAGCHRSAAPDTFTWSGRVAPGGWLRLRNLNGSVLVARATDGDVHIRAVKRYHGGRPEAVRFAVNPEGSDLVACALWGASGGSCTSARYASGRHAGAGLLRRLLYRERSVQVEFVVAVPAGVRVDASTVNGRVTVADVPGEVRAATTNGSVVLTALGGPVHARAVNGRVQVRVDSLAPTAELDAETVNGTVTALAPASLAGDIELSTVNGSARTDFALSGGTASAKQVRGRVGAGGPKLRLKAVNGNVRLLRVGTGEAGDEQ